MQYVCRETLYSSLRLEVRGRECGSSAEDFEVPDQCKKNQALADLCSYSEADKRLEELPPCLHVAPSKTAPTTTTNGLSLSFLVLSVLVQHIHDTH